jgi:hypothetical protein
MASNIKPYGRFAHATLQSIQLAEALQGLSVAMISEEFAAENTASTKESILNWETFVSELTAAHQNGTIQDFNQKASQILLPVIQQILAPPQETNGSPQQPTA